MNSVPEEEDAQDSGEEVHDSEPEQCGVGVGSEGSFGDLIICSSVPFFSPDST
jgi:hypothetical protein